MHIVHVSPVTFDPLAAASGGDRYPLALAEAMSQYCDVTLVSMGAAASASQSGGFRRIVLEARRHIGGRRSNPVPPVRRLFPLLREADLVHCHMMSTVLTDIVLAYCKLSQIPVVCTDHGGGGRSILQKVPAYRRAFDLFLPVSAFAARYMGHPAERSVPIFGGFDHGIFTRQHLAKEPRVVYVGRVSPHKGIDVIIQALPAGVEFRIIGQVVDTEYHQHLLRLAEGKRVTFRTGLSDRELAAEYGQALLFVLPSVTTDYRGVSHVNTEYLGLVLLEAMACGTAVAGSSVGGVPEVISPDAGFLVPSGDVARWKAVLQQVVSEPERLAAMGAAAAGHALGEFTWDAVARRALKAYGRILPGGDELK